MPINYELIKAMKEEEERQAALRRMAVEDPTQPSPVTQTPVLAPPTAPEVSPGRDPRLNEADTLSAQAAPRPGPKGMKENLIVGLRNGLEGLSGQYFPQEARRQATEHQRQQDLYERAKELRGEALQREQMNAQASRFSEQQMNERAQQAEVKRLHDAQIAEMQKPDFAHFGTATGGEIYGSVEGGQFSKQGEIAPASTKPQNPANLQVKTVVWKTKPADVNFNPDNGKYFDPTSGRDISAEVSHYEAPAKYGEPLAAVFDPKQGRNVLVGRSDAKGQTQAQPTAALQANDELENSYRKVKELGTLENDDFIGPAAGRYYKVKAMLPGTSLPEGYADFSALQADIKNHVIKMITGAQMGQQEATRILKQVPDETDKPEMWHAKYNQTLANVEKMKELIDRRRGTPTETVPTTATPTPTEPKRVRIKF